MSKLYIFAIGGTGSRVLKSLTFLLASGVKCNAEEIVPIIIDPDDANGDVSKTADLLRTYIRIRENLSFDSDTKNRFFEIPISSQTENFRIKIKNSNTEFRKFIDYSSLDEANKTLASLLFSKKNLDADMEVGFKGNPNIGSVVLNQFQESQDFKDFASSFGQNDRIFIISSIFGGTGAAGFPLLLKNLREATPPLDNHSYLNNADIGAISVLPYFGVKPETESEIEQSTFISKTRAALRYYEKGVNDSVNTMYYIGEEPKTGYENNEGGQEQRNDAHFIELASALAVIDFANTKVTGSNVVKEFGIKSDKQVLSFRDLDQTTSAEIFKPLTQYYLQFLFNANKLSQSFDQKFASELGLNSDFIRGEFYGDFRLFNKQFWEWLVQMDKNKRGFKPFTLENNSEEIFDSVIDIKLKNGGLFKSSNYNRYIEFLNKALKADPSAKNKASRFMEVSFLATENLVKEK